jgi:hypothetical protein
MIVDVCTMVDHLTDAGEYGDRVQLYASEAVSRTPRGCHRVALAAKWRRRGGRVLRSVSFLTGAAPTSLPLCA